MIVNKYYIVYYYKHQLKEGFDSTVCQGYEKLTEYDIKHIKEDIIFNFSMKSFKITDFAIINIIKLDK